MENTTTTLDITPNWEGVYRWLMNVKNTDVDIYHGIIKNGDGEWEKLLNMAKEKGWDK